MRRAAALRRAFTIVNGALMPRAFLAIELKREPKLFEGAINRVHRRNTVSAEVMIGAL